MDLRAVLLRVTIDGEVILDHATGESLEGCPACHTLDEVYLYGLGIVRSGGWMLQNPLFGGYASTTAYHPDSRIAIAVATTFRSRLR